MRWILGFVGLVMLAVGVAVLGLSAHALLSGMSLMQPLGNLWFAAHTSSLNATQVVFERYLWAPLWDHGVFPVLRMDSLTVLALSLGAGLLLLGLSIRGFRRR